MDTYLSLLHSFGYSFIKDELFQVPIVPHLPAIKLGTFFDDKKACQFLAENKESRSDFPRQLKRIIENESRPKQGNPNKFITIDKEAYEDQRTYEEREAADSFDQQWFGVRTKASRAILLKRVISGRGSTLNVYKCAYCAHKWVEEQIGARYTVLTKECDCVIPKPCPVPPSKQLMDTTDELLVWHMQPRREKPTKSAKKKKPDSEYSQLASQRWIDFLYMKKPEIVKEREPDELEDADSFAKEPFSCIRAWYYWLAGRQYTYGK